MFALRHKLDNLCIILNKDGMQAMGDIKGIMCLNLVEGKMWTCQWRLDASESFKNDKVKPIFIAANTVKGKGYMEHSIKFHYSAPNEEEYKQYGGTARRTSFINQHLEEARSNKKVILDIGDLGFMCRTSHGGNS